MTNETFEIELSRRNVLVSAGVLGGAGALGGAGTRAFFSDQERFPDNELVAGELDLKVDWQEHHSDWSPDENDDRLDVVEVTSNESDANLDEDPADDFEVRMVEDGTVPSGFVGLPTTFDPMVAVPEAFVNDFMANTAQEAFPDADGDDLKDLVMTRDQISTSYPSLSPAEVEAAFRDQFADVPDDAPRPLIELTDLKPGDFGEVTFSVHLFDNPAFVWMTGDVRSAAENGLTEPERKDPDEDGDATVELLDAVRAAVWHDDGDNVLEGEELVHAPHDVEGPDAIALPAEDALATTGTLREVLAALSGRLALDADPRTVDRDCFPNSTTRYVGFAWWLPVDHANEIQTDSVTFDLGFYVEQCRHNDGAGLPPEDPEVVFADQAGDGTSVVVDTAFLPNGGYVVIHRSDGGTPAEVVGHSPYLGPGTRRDLTVALDGTVASSQELIAMLHTDDGDTAYEFPGADGPYTVDGQPVVDAAQITVD